MLPSARCPNNVRCGHAAECDAVQEVVEGWTREQLAAWGIPWPPPPGASQSLRLDRPAMGGRRATHSIVMPREPTMDFEIRKISDVGVGHQVVARLGVPSQDRDPLCPIRLRVGPSAEALGPMPAQHPMPPAKNDGHQLTGKQLLRSAERLDAKFWHNIDAPCCSDRSERSARPLSAMGLLNEPIFAATV
jgi:hypothetical protein